MQNKWFINDKDTFETWGVAILKGSYAEILSPPKPRTRLEYGYLDEDGVRVDTTSPLTYEAYRYKIKVGIIADGFSDFWQKYNAFFSEISVPGNFSLKVAELGVTVSLLYEGATNIDRRIKINAGKVVSVFEINVFENNPKNRIYG